MEYKFPFIKPKELASAVLFAENILAKSPDKTPADSCQIAAKYYHVAVSDVAKHVKERAEIRGETLNFGDAETALPLDSDANFQRETLQLLREILALLKEKST